MQRPIVYQDQTDLTAGQTINNVVESNRLVQLPRSGFLTVYLNGSATGMRASCVIGNDEVLTDSAVNGFNRQIEADKDFLVTRIPVMAGERVTLKISNPTAGTLTAFYRLVLKPVGR